MKKIGLLACALLLGVAAGLLWPGGDMEPQGLYETLLERPVSFSLEYLPEGEKTGGYEYWDVGEVLRTYDRLMADGEEVSRKEVPLLTGGEIPVVEYSFRDGVSGYLYMIYDPAEDCSYLYHRRPVFYEFSGRTAFGRIEKVVAE